jgi:ketosteroid isomerase-like protein
MSQENVELAREGVAAINETYRTGDVTPWRRHVEAAFDADVALDAAADVFTEGRWRGHEGAVAFVANQMGVLENMWLRADEYIDVDDECLVLALTFGGRAQHSGIPFELSPAHVFRMRNGKAVRWQVFASREQALEAVGLSEQPGSQSNVDIVRKIYDAVARRDDVTPFELYAEDIVWDLSRWRRAGLDSKPPLYVGHEGVRQSWLESLDAFDAIDLEVEELIDAGDRVVAVVRERVRGRASGAAVPGAHTAVWTLADGKVTRMQVFNERREALAAVGLSE